MLGQAETVVIAGHEKADGDAVGAVAAMRRHLEIEGKRVKAILTEPLNPRYAFMEFGRSYEVYEPRRHDALLQSCDVFVMCDLSSMPRLGPLLGGLEGTSATTVCFDHHPCENDGPAAINVLDPRATATGVLVYDYIQHVGGTIDREIAESVFVSLSTDTGWFRYPNTNDKVMALAAELARHRIDFPGIYRSIYQSNSAPMLRLLGHVARSMNEECGGALVWAQVRLELLRSLGVERYESDPILDVLRSGEDVQVVALFTELDDGRVSVSLRSRGKPDMNVVARRFGGGGHVYAAGTTLPADDAEELRRAMVGVLRREVEAL
ncbi:MAG: bifunctional oligoribonuclease/PAP phosphatase NrnA [Planctomycetes bacterium]|nr:bifunctional oligoribonuclease/PAP phosphatase NrnA [Planctomycetota bacterium]